MKRIALIVLLLVATACGTNRSSSHPMSPATAIVLTGVAAGTLGLLIWAGSACEHCDEYRETAPRPYPYPPATEW